jgi:hypothetical protein
MKGTLTKTEKGWVVNYNYSVNNNDWCTILLHPDFIEMMDTCFTSKFTHEIEFEIVTEWETGEVGVNGLTYAKLIHHPVDTNKMIDHIGEVNEMVKDDVEKLAEEFYPLNEELYPNSTLIRKAFIEGYNKAKETLYTEEQVREVIEKAKLLDYNNKFVFTTDHLILSLKQPKQ